MYLTLNTLPRNDEIDRLSPFIKAVAHLGIDAFIITDLGTLSLVKENAPDVDIHISVQTGIVNYRSALFYYNLGAKRIVLARELTLCEISEIRAKTPPDLEIEAFVHGAICMSVSGRCLISNYLTGRDANRGDCAQPCRWKYHLVEEKRPGEYMEIYEENGGAYVLNANDMCLINHIPALAKAGITSLKIEGRAKTDYYVAVITNAYRNAVDGYLTEGEGYQTPDWIMNEVDKVSHRAYTKGFYFGPPENPQTYDNGGYIRNYELIAVAEDYSDGILTVIQKNKFYPGTYDVLEPGNAPFAITAEQLYDETMNPIEAAPHPTMKVKFLSPPVKKGAYLRIKKT